MERYFWPAGSLQVSMNTFGYDHLKHIRRTFKIQLPSVAF